MALEKERINKDKEREKEFIESRKKMEREREGIEVSFKDLRVEKVDREDLCTEKTV